MPSFCSILSCSDKYGRNDNNISFHKYPAKHNDLLEKWLKFTQRTNWKPSRWSSICSRHFCDEDFRCVNERRQLRKDAVPSILHFTHYSTHGGEGNVRKSKLKARELDANTDSEDEPDNMETNLSLANSSNLTKSNCRLCGHIASSAVTFSSNFEIYGMIQKCFPTLNIKQDDNLPKEMCHACLKRLKSFSSFIDIVLQTQSELQMKFRSEKQSSKVMERQLKIKQEPNVRVKQEEIEGFDSFLHEDLDLGIEDHCDQEQNEAVDEKLQFCDFPMLNTQDIINNCDIMEIINLDDPFINIPDDDVNLGTNCGELAKSSRISDKETLSAHDLLQAHLISDEHCYAHPAEVDKEDYINNNFCKTEKSENFECRDLESEQNYSIDDTPLPQQQDEQTGNLDEAVGNFLSVPIDAHVNTIQESNLQYSLNDASFAESAIKDGPSAIKQPDSQRKPNIVVLNESIVKSSAAFQLHTCTDCQLKFFGIESLKQHCSLIHGQAPMVSVPKDNVERLGADSRSPIGAKCHSATWQHRPTTTLSNALPFHGFGRNERTNQYGYAYHKSGIQASHRTEQDCETSNKTTILRRAGSDASTELKDRNLGKAKINILEIKQSFSSPNDENCFSDCLLKGFNIHDLGTRPVIDIHLNSPFSGIVEKLPKISEQFESDEVAAETCVRNAASNSIDEESSSKSTAVLKQSFQSNNIDTHRMEKLPETAFNKIKQKYLKLQKSALRLRKIYKKMQMREKLKQNHACRLCKGRFRTVKQLWDHKRNKIHFVRKPMPPFSGNCPGCEKFFCYKIGLKNHMRYICQSLSLRWALPQMKTFRCKYCRKILFTHWRLCRKHEITCKLNQRTTKRGTNKAKCTKCNRKNKRTRLKTKIINPPKRSYPCVQCDKVFSNSKNFYQHKFTHTEERNFKCNMCVRAFKRRNGLTQHIKSFHLQIKPHECSRCHHRYALKTDMLRCRHSIILKHKKSIE